MVEVKGIESISMRSRIGRRSAGAGVEDHICLRQRRTAI